MLANDAQTKAVLDRMEGFEAFIAATARRFTPDTELQQDLAQEMRIRLWKALMDDREYTDSYLRQACVRRSQDYLKSGRSVDARKRRSSRSPLNEDSAHTNPTDMVATLEFVHQLQHDLIGSARDVADRLARGQKAAQIAVGFGVTRQAICHRMAQIRDVAKQLDAKSTPPRMSAAG